LNVTVRKYVPGVKPDGGVPLGKSATICVLVLLMAGKLKESSVTCGELPKF
jgi:hypothetical protein